MKKSNVEVKVLAINTLYEYAEKCIQHEKDHFSQFLGQDIFKVDGSIKAKFAHERLSFKGQMQDGTWYDVHYWFEKRSGYFEINIKICVNGGSYDVRPATAFCQYESLSSILFKVVDGKLTISDNNTDYLKKRYTVSELMEIKKGIDKAAGVYKAEYDKMPYIFKDVFYIERLAR